MPQSVFGRVDSNLLAERGVPDYTGVQTHTSALSIPIPLFWGTRRISPNIIWANANDNPTPRGGASVVDGPDVGGNGYTRVSTFALAQFAQPLAVTIVGGAHAGTYGSTDPLNSACHWQVPAILGLCEGPIDEIKRVWNPGGGPAIPWLNTYAAGLTPPSLFYTLFAGSSSQTAWGYFAALATAHPPGLPGQDLAYRFTAYIATPFLDSGHNEGGHRGQPAQQAFDVVRTPNISYRVPDSYGIAYDYSAADFIPDLLESTQYGNGFAGGDFDALSLLQFAAYIFAQGLFLSPLLTSQTPVVDLINRWAIELNSWIFWSGVAMYFVPLGDEVVTGNSTTFTPDTSPAYNLGMGDFLTPVVVDRSDPIDCFNRVRLEFCDRATDYAKNPIEWKDSTLINQYGILDASNIDGQDCCDIVVAAKIVELVGKRMAYIRNHYSFTLSYRYIRILPGTIVTLTDPNLGLSLQPVRVVSIDENEKGELAIVAEEYPGTLGLSRPVSVQAWTSTGGGGTGTAGGSGSTGTGLPTPTSGGVLVMDPAMTLVLYVAGDVITLPPDPLVPGRVYVFLHDQQRSPQPTPAILEDNPTTWQRPGGATYNIVDPSDGTLAAASFVKLRTSGLTIRFVFDATAGLLRWLA